MRVLVLLISNQKSLLGLAASVTLFWANQAAGHKAFLPLEPPSQARPHEGFEEQFWEEVQPSKEGAFVEIATAIVGDANESKSLERIEAALVERFDSWCATRGPCRAPYMEIMAHALSCTVRRANRHMHQCALAVSWARVVPNLAEGKLMSEGGSLLCGFDVLGPVAIFLRSSEEQLGLLHKNRQLLGDMGPTPEAPAMQARDWPAIFAKCTRHLGFDH